MLHTQRGGNLRPPGRRERQILSQLKHPPRLAVATHFPAADDTAEGEGLPDWLPESARQGARKDMRSWYPDGDLSIASDLLVLNVTKSAIRQRRSVVSGYAWPTSVAQHGDLTEPKYHDLDGSGDPYAQLDPDAPVIDPDIYNAK